MSQIPSSQGASAPKDTTSAQDADERRQSGNGLAGSSGGAPDTAVVVREFPRRDWLFGVGMAVNVAAGLLLAIPLIGFVFSSFVERKDPRSWISLGSLEGFPENATRIATYRNPYTRPWDGQTADIPCWVRRLTGQQFQVFAINCTHLGCPVRWFRESGLFLCPCHGGAYYEDGSRAAGPPPRGLFQYDYKVENGALWVKGGEMPTLSNPV